MKKIISILLIFLTLNLYCENEPEAYNYDDFHPVLLGVRRASVVFVGALPLGYMYSSIVSDNFLSEPDNELYGSLDDSEKVEFKLASSLIFAGLVTVIDLVIEYLFRRQK